MPVLQDRYHYLYFLSEKLKVFNNLPRDLTSLLSHPEPLFLLYCANSRRRCCSVAPVSSQLESRMRHTPSSAIPETGRKHVSSVLTGPSSLVPTQLARFTEGWLLPWRLCLRFQLCLSVSLAGLFCPILFSWPHLLGNREYWILCLCPLTID